MTPTTQPIYLDGFATMPLAPEAREAMFVAWANPANAGSPHILGELAAASVAAARATIAELIGASASEIVFTSGATEANNLALIGIARWALETGNTRQRIVVSAVEHKAILEPAHWLKALGFEVIVAPVDHRGAIDCTVLSTLVDEHTLLVSVMAANNETGVLQPMSDVVAICRRNGALIHCDGAQAIGKIPLEVVELDLDYMSFSSHKMYGPAGVGGLYISAAAPTPRPIHLGGGQQSSVRPGTEPVPLIIGFGVAAGLARDRLAADGEHGRQLARRLLARLHEHQVGCSQITDDAPVLPGSLSLMAPGIEADDLVAMLRTTVCLSTGSACTAGQVLPSHVLSAMGMSQVDASSVFRIYCGRYNTEADIDLAATLIADACLRVRHRTGRPHQ
ncbi:cysteine desulfurase family protein [Sphingomonas sp. 28-63-12]|uniref:cysteine desulfurase family protein n=1 Tax=Sphingomonas sp. 28-63-12 TaxID=1970434 RepID=UPI0035A84C95